MNSTLRLVPPAFTLSMLMSVCCSATNAFAAQPAPAPPPSPIVALQPLAPTNDSEILQALDLTAPGMERVKEASEKNDITAIKAAYLDYRRNDSKAIWYSMPAQMPVPIASNDATGEEILHHQIRDYVYGNWHRQPVDMGANFNWIHNPLPKSDPNYSEEWTWCAISRTQFWRKLGEAYWKTHNEAYPREWVKELFDFASKNPLGPTKGRGEGSMWRTLDASIRANETWPDAYYHMMNSPEFTPEAQWIFLKLVRDHALLLERALQAPDRSGNWVASESAGLFTIGTLFPELRESGKWRDEAIHRILREMNSVVPPDGFEAELTPNYDLVSLHGYLDPLRLAELNHATVPVEFKPKLMSMFEALVKVMNQKGELVATNDSGRVSAIQPAREGLRLMDDPLLEWAVSGGTKGKGLPDSTMLPYAGFFTMRSGWKPEDQFLFFRAGPPGIGHEHEDMLQIVYEAYGKTLLREGPESGYDHSNFRRFALNTGSYSTVTVDGMTQHRGPNRPPVTTPAPADWVTSPLFDYAAATYDAGYQKSVYEPSIEYHPERWIGSPDKSVTHTRRVLYLRPYYALVIDSIDGSGDHTVDARFNVASPSVRIDAKTQAAFSENAGEAQVALFPLDLANQSVRVLQGERGSSDIVWDVPTVEFEKSQNVPATFATLLFPYRGQSPAIQEQTLPPSPGIWKRKLVTPYETVSVVLSRTTLPSELSIDIERGGTLTATASLLISRTPLNGPHIPLFGARSLVRVQSGRADFTLDHRADLLFTLQNGDPVISNPGTEELTVRFSAPFVKTVKVAASSTVRITKSTQETIDGASVFALPVAELSR